MEVKFGSEFEHEMYIRPVYIKDGHLKMNFYITPTPVFCGADMWYDFIYSRDLRWDSRHEHQLALLNFLRKVYIHMYEDPVESDEDNWDEPEEEELVGDTGYWFFETRQRLMYHMPEALGIDTYQEGINRNSQNKWRWVYVPFSAEVYAHCLNKVREYEKENSV